MKITFIFFLIFSATVSAKTYDCKPDIKYECSPERCDRVSEDFQHAESFSYTQTNKISILSACLWTACFEGNAHKFKTEDNFTVIGKLTSNAPDKTKRVVSLTISKDNKFTAIWNYGGSNTTSDFGTCNVKP